MTRAASSRHWYVTLATGLSRGGELRTAVLIITPQDRRFVEFEYGCASSQLERAVEIIVSAYAEEAWFRRPGEIRTATRELTTALADLRDVFVRTDAKSRKFTHAVARYQAHTASN